MTPSRGEFCRIHAFYDCPLCRGEEVVWVIPVVDGRGTDGYDNVVGVIEIPEEFEPEEGYLIYEGPGEQAPPVPLPAEVYRDPDPDAERLLAAVREMFDWRNEPRHVAAAARGRAIHEAALKAIDEDPDLDYQTTIEEIAATWEEREGG